jgi:fatty-acyl-CoA synthase
VLVAPEPKALDEEGVAFAAETMAAEPDAPVALAAEAPHEPEIEDAVIEDAAAEVDTGRPPPPPSTIAEMAPPPTVVATGGPPASEEPAAATSMAWATAPSPKPGPQPEPEPEPETAAQTSPAAIPVGVGAMAAGLAVLAAAKWPTKPEAGHVAAPTVIALGGAEHVAVMPAEPAEGGALPEPLPNMPDLTPAGAARPPAPKPQPVSSGAATGPKPTSAPAKDAGAPLTLAPPSPPPGEPLAFAFSPSVAPVRGKAKGRPVGKQAAAPPLAAGYLTLAVLLAFTPALMVAGGAVATRMGWMDWREGFTAVLEHGPTPQLGWAPAIALVSLAVSLLGVLIALFAGWGKLWGRALLALLVSVATLAAFWAVSVGAARVPAIHEAATDWRDPLTFSAATLKARAESGATAAVEPDPVLPIGSEAYAGRRVADINAETCPGAQPVLLSEAPALAFAAALNALSANGLTVTNQDPAEGRLEAVATTPIYGFKDDVAVRVMPTAEGARIDIRSTSRVGVGDLGLNCRRVSDLVAALRG